MRVPSNVEGLLRYYGVNDGARWTYAKQFVERVYGLHFFKELIDKIPENNRVLSLYVFFFLKLKLRLVDVIFIDYYHLNFRVNRKLLLHCFFFFKNHTNCLFHVLHDIIALDFPGNQKRFKVVYNLYTTHYNARVRLYTKVSQLDYLDSVTPIFNSANWLEREVYDMFGILFNGHPDLRRILTDYGFKGYPLRKDFPLSGFSEVSYDSSQRKLIFTKVSFAQELRLFKYYKVW